MEYITNLINNKFTIIEKGTSHFFEPLPKNNSNDFLLKKIYIVFYIIFGSVVNEIKFKTNKGQEIVIFAEKR